MGTQNIGLVAREKFLEVVKARLKEQDDKIDELSATLGTKLREQDKEIEKLKQDMLDFYEMLDQGIKLIEALEERTKRVEEEFMDHLVNEHNIEIRKPKRVDVPTDKFDKPPGGLEPGDVISCVVDEKTSDHHGKKIFGQFYRADNLRNWIWAYWQNVESGEIENIKQWMNKDRVTFEFRPRFPDRKER